MINKVIIKASFPLIDKEYDIKIPVNELVWKIKKLVVKAIYDLNCVDLDIVNDKFVMINKSTGRIYNNNEIIIDTDIRNGSEIMFFIEN